MEQKTSTNVSFYCVFRGWKTFCSRSDGSLTVVTLLVRAPFFFVMFLIKLSPGFKRFGGRFLLRDIEKETRF